MIEPFQIVALKAGRGQIGLCRLPGRSGALAADVAAIRDWKPAIVVSMTESTEMMELGAGELARQLKEAGIDWRHFPVVDFGVPDQETALRWPVLSRDLHHALGAGQKILLHCRGGLGRSGMMALRLMAEQGEAADVALQRLRAIRPGAVETDQQRAWAIAPLP